MRCHYLFLQPLSNSNVTGYEVLVSNTPPCSLDHKHENKDALYGSSFQHLHSTWHKVRIHYTVFTRDQLSVPPWYTLEDLKPDFCVWATHPKSCVKRSMLKQKKNITKCLLWELSGSSEHFSSKLSILKYLHVLIHTYLFLIPLGNPMGSSSFHDDPNTHCYCSSRSVVGRCVDHYHHVPNLSRHTGTTWIVIIPSLWSNQWSFLKFYFSHPFESIPTETTFHPAL